MQELNLEEMNSLEGGTCREVITCTVFAIVMGFVNPVLGAINSVLCLAIECE